MWQLNHVNINRELANQHPEAWSRILELWRQGVASTDPRMQQKFSVAARLVRFFNPDNANSLLATIPDFRPRLENLGVPLLILAGAMIEPCIRSCNKSLWNMRRRRV
jgi:proline iminopeptidase